MPYFLILGLFFALLNPTLSLASEDVDPFVAGFSEDYLSEEKNVVPPENTPAPPAPFVDEEYFNFEDMEYGNANDFNGEEPYDSTSSAPVNVPMIQAPIPTLEEIEPETKPIPKIQKDQALTDTLKQDTLPAGSESIIPLPKVEGTWVDKLSSSNPLAVLGSSGNASSSSKTSSTTLEGMVDSARKIKNSRSNASVFDISGVMLRMSTKQVDETMQNRGFKKIMQKYQIPNFIKWRNEETCRNVGVVGYERLDACVVERSKKDKQQYVQVAKYSKFDTKEEIEVTFTSNYTDNKVYKIIYKSMAASVTGNSAKAVYLRNIKIYDFWKKINQKYGAPDNKEDVTWGLGGNKPYLKAQTGNLLLEDPMFRELDYTRMSREDQRYMNTDLYSF